MYFKSGTQLTYKQLLQHFQHKRNTVTIQLTFPLGIPPEYGWYTKIRLQYFW